MTAQGDHWVDSAIALGQTARADDHAARSRRRPAGRGAVQPGPRIRGADQERSALAQLDDVAEAGKWAEVIRPKTIQSACLVDGHWYCVPVNIHSWPWAWYSKEAFAKAGLPDPKNFDEFVADAPKLQEAGIIPLAIGGDGNGWQIKGAFDQMLLDGLGIENRDQMYRDKDLDDRRRCRTC